ncbi:sterol desaturase family protein, partial [Vibrio parahaemolyticus]|nr:sterol desaturase family protein [Vibrio parahaemolyticus]
LSLVAFNSLVIALIMPIAAFQAAVIAQEQQWGLLNILSLPAWLNIFLTVILLDFVIYAQHIVFHHVKPLWKIHRMHHADLDIDVTTGARFHPFEIIISMG